MAEELDINFAENVNDVSAVENTNQVPNITETVTETREGLQDNMVPNPLVETNSVIETDPDKPQTPPAKFTPNSFTSRMNANIDNIIINKYKEPTPKPGEFVMPGPKTRYGGKELDLYKYQEDFNPFGFNPFDKDNFKYEADRETWGSALSKGLDSFATRFGNTWTDSFASYVRMGSALVNWDWSKMMPTEGEMIEQNWAEHIESMKNFVFVPPEQEEDLFSKRTISEFIGNTGFALGTFGALATELVADAAITYATGGAGGGTIAATLAKFGAKEAAVQGAKLGIKETVKKGAVKFGDFLADVGRGATYYGNQSADALSAATKVANKTQQARRLSEAGKVGVDSLRESMKEVFDIYSMNLRGIVKSKSFEELALNLAKGIPVVGTGVRYGEKIAAGAKAGLSTGKLVGIGLLGTKRMATEVNMASTEAGFEGVSTYGQTLDLMVDNYKRENDGKSPNPDEFAAMQSKAMQAATSNYNTNMMLLLLTNRLQLGGLMNKWISSTKVTKELLEEGAENILGVNRIGKAAAGELLGKSYKLNTFNAMFPVLGRYGIYKKIATDFGKKQALYEVGKAFTKSGFKMEITEGLQENLQEMTAEAWKNYYAGQYNGAKYTLSKAFDKALDSQFTKQGLRTFLQGALTGGVIRPFTVGVNGVVNYMQEKAAARQYKDNPSENPYVKIKSQLEKDIQVQNDLLKQLSDRKFEDNFISFTNQIDTTVGQTEAAINSSQYEWQNYKDGSVLSGMLAANRTGTGSMYVQALKDLGKNMSTEEFEKSFGVKLSQTKYSSVQEIMENAAKDVKKYQDTIDGVRRGLKEMPDPLMYEKDSEDRVFAAMAHNAREEAIKIVAANAIRATRASERVIDLANRFKKIPGLQNSSEFALRVTANPENFRAELGNYLAEIKLLQESLAVLEPEQKQQVVEKINQKKEMVNLLDKWLEFWSVRENILSGTPLDETIDRRDFQYDTFVGRKDYIVETDSEGKVINPKKEIYILDHKDVAETLRKIINLKNKEAGIPDQVSEKDFREGFDVLVDYIRLDQDAKDYMEKMDVLYNPEYYTKTVKRIIDGRLKYDLLEYVDSLQPRLNEVISQTIYAADIKDPIERILLVKKLVDELDKMLKESDAYKNLVMVSIDEKLGYSNMKFIKENAKKLDEMLQDKFAEILNTYASVATEDLTEAEYQKFKNDKKVSNINLSIIARKLVQSETLGKYQQEVLESEEYAKEIENIKSRIEFIKKDNIKSIREMALSQEVTRRLINAGIATEQELSVLTAEQIIDLGLQKGLITPDDIAKNVKQYEPIDDNVWDNFTTEKVLPDDIVRAIAEKDFKGEELSFREKQVIESRIYENDILKIQDELEIIEEEKQKKNEENNIQTSDVNPVTVNTKTDPVTNVVSNTTETVTAGPKPTTVIENPVTDQDSSISESTPEQDDQSAGLLSKLKARNQGNKQTLENLKDVAEGKPIEEKPFNVEGTENSASVVSRNGTTLTPEPTTLKEAEVIANSANNLFDNLDWSKKRLQEFLKLDTVSEQDVNDFVTTVKNELENYNKDNAKPIESFKDFELTKEGKDVISTALNAFLKNETPQQEVKKAKSARNQKKKEAKKQKNVETTSTENDKFGTITEQASGPAIAIVSEMEKYDEDIKQIVSTKDKMNKEIMLTLSSVQDDALFLGERKATPEETAQERQIVNDIKQKYAEQMSEKNRKFVDEGALTEKDVLDQIDKLNTCL